MADRTAAHAFGNMFRMLAHKGKLTPQQRRFAHYLLRVSEDYDFDRSQMYAEPSLVKLGFIQPREVENNTFEPPVGTPAQAFSAMHDVFARDVNSAAEREENGEDVRDYLCSIVRDSKKMASFAPLFGVSVKGLAVRDPSVYGEQIQRTGHNAKRMRAVTEDVKTTVYRAPAVAADDGIAWADVLSSALIGSSIVVGGYLIYKIFSPTPTVP